MSRCAGVIHLSLPPFPIIHTPAQPINKATHAMQRLAISLAYNHLRSYIASRTSFQLSLCPLLLCHCVCPCCRPACCCVVRCVLLCRLCVASGRPEEQRASTQRHDTQHIASNATRTLSHTIVSLAPLSLIDSTCLTTPHSSPHRRLTRQQRRNHPHQPPHTLLTHRCITRELSTSHRPCVI